MTTTGAAEGIAMHPNNYRISDRGLDLIKEFTRYSRYPYPHPCGLDAIGFEHIIRPADKDLHRVDALQATELLREDVRTYEIYVNSAVRIVLEQHEFDALVSLVSDVGILDFERSPVRTRLNDGDRWMAIKALSNWGASGIYRQPSNAERRRREATLFFWGSL